MTLSNGPYNGRDIEDSGTVIVRMAIYDGGKVVGATIGEAIYEPDENRERAFWSHNNWLGRLEGIIPAEQGDADFA